MEGRLQALRDLQRGASTQRDEAASTLASTPMRFGYESGVVDPGYTDGLIIGDVKDGWRNIVLGTGVLLTMFISVLPWAVGVLSLDLLNDIVCRSFNVPNSSR